MYPAHFLRAMTMADASFSRGVHVRLWPSARTPLQKLSPRKLHPVFHLKGGICVQKKDAQFPRVST